MKHYFALLTGLLLCLCSVQAFAASKVNVGLNDVIATVEKSFNPTAADWRPLAT